MYKTIIKRILDILVSTIILTLLLPLFILVIILIKIDSKGSIFFIQKRVGKDLKIFEIIKFRTMTIERREVTNKPIIGKDLGVTKIGYFLRRLKIDELPQLLNVLKGDMSLVGPRPSIEKQLLNMTENEKFRYSANPGLTGLAQVSGNIHLPWKERYIYDLEYIKNISFLNDLKILFRTIILIFVGEDKFINNPLKLRKRNEII